MRKGRERANLRADLRGTGPPDRRALAKGSQQGKTSTLERRCFSPFPPIEQFHCAVEQSSCVQTACAQPLLLPIQRAERSKGEAIVVARTPSDMLPPVKYLGRLRLETGRPGDVERNPAGTRDRHVPGVRERAGDTGAGAQLIGGSARPADGARRDGDDACSRQRCDERALHFRRPAIRATIGGRDRAEEEKIVWFVLVHSQPLPRRQSCRTEKTVRSHVRGPAMSVMRPTLPAPLKRWVQAQATERRNFKGSEYIRALIGREQFRQDAVARLRSLIAEAGAQGLDAAAIDDFGRRR